MEKPSRSGGVPTAESRLREILGTEHASVEVRRVLPRLLELLADGVRIDSKHLERFSGWGPELWGQLQEWGAEVDQEGRIVGIAGLSILWTPHRVESGNRRYYTWCALDALVLPQTLGEEATIASVCPATGVPISLSISRDGAVRHELPDLTLSVVVPARGSPAGGTCLRRSLVGRQGFFCSRVWFFSSREAGRRWLGDGKTSVMMSPREGAALARSLWHDPLNVAQSRKGTAQPDP